MLRHLPLLLLLMACSSPAPSDPDALVTAPDASPSCAEATTHSDLAWIQDRIFATSCSAFTACHKGAASEAGGLNLETGMSHSQMVGVDSTLFPQFKRVAAGDPSNSYLLMILGHIEGPIDPDVGTMPGGNNPLLCVEKRAAIERWITAGAPE